MSNCYFIQTARLGIRRADAADAEFIHALWTSPEVMKYVGFSQGLPITVEAVRRQLCEGPEGEFGSRLMVEDLVSGDRIGQTKLSIPDEHGICEPDIKLHPSTWGKGYGRELWHALIDYAFEHSDARTVQGTPNRSNTASVRMQRGAGMIQVGEGVFETHIGKVPGAIPVPHYVLHISREAWEAQASKRQPEE